MPFPCFADFLGSDFLKCSIECLEHSNETSNCILVKQNLQHAELSRDVLKSVLVDCRKLWMSYLSLNYIKLHYYC